MRWKYPPKFYLIMDLSLQYVWFLCYNAFNRFILVNYSFGSFYSSRLHFPTIIELLCCVEGYQGLYKWTKEELGVSLWECIFIYKSKEEYHLLFLQGNLCLNVWEHCEIDHSKEEFFVMEKRKRDFTVLH